MMLIYIILIEHLIDTNYNYSIPRAPVFFSHTGYNHYNHPHPNKYTWYNPNINKMHTWTTTNNYQPKTTTTNNYQPQTTTINHNQQLPTTTNN